MKHSTNKYSLNIFNSLAKKLWNNNEGATAVEFALIGPVFFALLFSTFELGVLTVKSTLLELAAAEASKKIYIGAVSTGGVTSEDLQESICERISYIDSNCRDNLTLELTPISDFNSIPNTDATCTDSDVEIKPTVTFTPGNSNETVYMRICLTTNVNIPGIGFGLSLVKTETGKTQLVSALAFSNEPF